MIGIFNNRFALTDTTDRLGVLLTLLFFATFPIHAHSANDANSIYANGGYFQNSIRTQSVIGTSEEDQKRNALADYVRGQALNLAPGLPDEVRSTVRWAMDGLHSSRGLFSLDVSTLGQDEDEAPQDDNPIAKLAQPLPVEQNETPLLAQTAYHHRNGILPTRDAMLLGSHTRQSFLDNYMRFDFHPYFGQNYFSARHYYGAEAKLDLARPTGTTSSAKPWGTVSIGYTNGDDRLMDHGHGIDMHTEVYFNDHLSLNSGVRQSDTSGSGNYVLLQWKISTE